MANLNYKHFVKMIEALKNQKLSLEQKISDEKRANANIRNRTVIEELKGEPEETYQEIVTTQYDEALDTVNEAIAILEDEINKVSFNIGLSGLKEPVSSIS